MYESVIISNEQGAYIEEPAELCNVSVSGAAVLVRAERTDVMSVVTAGVSSCKKHWSSRQMLTMTFGQMGLLLRQAVSTCELAISNKSWTPNVVGD